MKGLGETIVEHRDKGECHCRGCAGRIPFEMPDQLAEAYVRGDLIVFAGAGASGPVRNSCGLFEGMSALAANHLSCPGSARM